MKRRREGEANVRFHQTKYFRLTKKWSSENIPCKRSKKVVNSTNVYVTKEIITKFNSFIKCQDHKRGCFFLTYDASLLPNSSSVDEVALTLTKTPFQNFFDFNDIFSKMEIVKRS
jgi:hypothetical protein